jgi:hypothetical protein
LNCRSYGSGVQQREKLISSGPVCPGQFEASKRNNYAFINITIWYYSATFIVLTA